MYVIDYAIFHYDAERLRKRDNLSLQNKDNAGNI